MKSWILLMSLLGVMFAFSAQAAQQVTVNARVDQTRVAPGKPLQFMVTINNGDGNIDLSGLTEFKIFSRGTSTSVQIIGNQQSRKVTHTYLLLPQRKGRLTVPAVPVTVNGQVLRTTPIVIDVAPETESPRGENPKEVWVDATVSNSTPFVGEQVTYRFVLYQAVRVTEATYEPPTFEGFTAKRVKDRESKRTYIEGREYVISEIDYVLVPITAGAKTIGPSVLQLGIVRSDGRRRRSSFDDLFNRHRIEPRVMHSNPLEVNVQALPSLQEGRFFSGLVGRFDMTATVENTKLKVGDSTTLTLTLKGTGNLMDAKSPMLDIPDGLKAYADTPEETIQLTDKGYSGTKIFRTALVPVHTGDAQIPPVQITYFDVSRKAYRDLSALLPQIQVTPGDQDQTVPLTGTPEAVEAKKQKVAFTGRDILPLKGGLVALKSQQSLPWYWFLLWLMAPGAGVGVLAVIQRLRLKDPHPAVRMRKRAKQALKKAHAKGSDHPEFLTALYQAQTAAIFAKLGRMGEALTWSEAEACLCECGVPVEIAKEAAGLFKSLESSRYSGGAMLTDEQRTRMLAQTRKMVKQLAP